MVLKGKILGKLLSIAVVVSLVAVLTGKLFFTNQITNNLLYVYGLSVTLVVLGTFTISFFLYKDPYLLAKNIPESEKNRYKVSILVAAKNEEKFIGKCVDSLINQNYQNKEIIVINDGSTDNTQTVLEKYYKEGLIKVINLKKNIGKKRALGKGILKSRGDILLFTDSDSILAPDVSEKIVDVFNLDAKIGAVSGHCRAMNGDKNFLTRMQDSWYEGQFSIRKAFESVFDSITCVSGPLAAFRREAIFNLIPAWENDSFLGQEFKFATDRTLTGFVLGNGVISKKIKNKYKDSPFVRREKYNAKDWKIVYCKSARSMTIVPDTFKKVIKQQIRWKKSFIRNAFFTGSFYWRKPIIPAIAYYVHILFAVFGPIIVISHLIDIFVKGNVLSSALYFGGIFFIGSCFAVAYKVENKKCNRWIYRPLMSLFSTLVLSWLIFYSLLTI